MEHRNMLENQVKAKEDQELTIKAALEQIIKKIHKLETNHLEHLLAENNEAASQNKPDEDSDDKGDRLTNATVEQLEKALAKLEKNETADGLNILQGITKQQQLIAEAVKNKEGFSIDVINAQSKAEEAIAAIEVRVEVRKKELSELILIKKEGLEKVKTLEQQVLAAKAELDKIKQAAKQGTNKQLKQEISNETGDFETPVINESDKFIAARVNEFGKSVEKYTNNVETEKNNLILVLEDEIELARVKILLLFEDDKTNVEVAQLKLLQDSTIPQLVEQRKVKIEALQVLKKVNIDNAFTNEYLVLVKAIKNKEQVLNSEVLALQQRVEDAKVLLGEINIVAKTGSPEQIAALSLEDEVNKFKEPSINKDDALNAVKVAEFERLVGEYENKVNQAKNDLIKALKDEIEAAKIAIEQQFKDGENVQKVGALEQLQTAIAQAIIARGVKIAALKQLDKTFDIDNKFDNEFKGQFLVLKQHIDDVNLVVVNYKAKIEEFNTEITAEFKKSNGDPIQTKDWMDGSDAKIRKLIAQRNDLIEKAKLLDGTYLQDKDFKNDFSQNLIDLVNRVQLMNDAIKRRTEIEQQIQAKLKEAEGGKALKVLQDSCAAICTGDECLITKRGVAQKEVEKYCTGSAGNNFQNENDALKERIKTNEDIMKLLNPINDELNKILTNDLDHTRFLGVKRNPGAQADNPKDPEANTYDSLEIGDLSKITEWLTKENYAGKAENKKESIKEQRKHGQNLATDIVLNLDALDKAADEVIVKAKNKFNQLQVAIKKLLNDITNGIEEIKKGLLEPDLDEKKKTNYRIN